MLSPLLYVSEEAYENAWKEKFFFVQERKLLRSIRQSLSLKYS